MPGRKKSTYNDKELLSAISGTIPALYDQQSLPLRETAFLALRKLILTGKLHPGERLSEDRLGKILGTSRTPIREAIRKLEREGLVTIIPGNGARVAKITLEDLQDIMEVWSALDRLCASLASTRITEEEKKELIKAEKTFEYKARFGNEQEITESDVCFHALIAKIARNRLLDQIMISLEDALYRYRYAYIRDDLHYEDLIEDHRTICSAILIGNALEASCATSEHIKRLHDFFTGQIRKTQRNSAE